MSDESVIKFPTPFPIKMMGKDTPEFRATVRTLVERHTGPIDDSAISDAISRKGNFVSITITVIATSQKQLDDIYRDVSAHDDVLMAL